MKGHFSTLSLIVLLSISSFAQRSKKDEINGDYFLVKGSVYQINILDEGEVKASNVQVVVYQEKELYVAFFTDEIGAYSFNLPIGKNYEIWFGGGAFVNKKVTIDAVQFPKEKKPRLVPLDMGLFRPLEGYNFPMLDIPFVKLGYDPEMDQVAPDMVYTAKQSDELNKYVKKVQKEITKKNKKKK